MWVFTTRGFYSAVEKREDRAEGMITVRARVKGDLTRLEDLLPDAKPYRVKYSDYPWRIRVTREDWALAMARMALEVSYTNFKDEVRRRFGAKREGVYHRVWFELLALEQKRATPRKSKGKRSKGYKVPVDPLFEGQVPIVPEGYIYDEERLEQWPKDRA